MITSQLNGLPPYLPAALQAVFIPPVLVVFVVALAILTFAVIIQKPFERELCKPYYWLVLTHLLFFPAVITAGVIWANPVTNPTSSTSRH